MFDNVWQCLTMFDNVAAPTLLHLKNLLGSLITEQFNKLIPCDKTVINGIREYASMRCILVLINIIKHRQISLTCLLPTHPRPSQPRYDTDDTDLRDSVWKEAHVTSEYLTIFDTFECWDFLLMASIEQILNEYKYFGNVSRGWRLATSCVLYWRHLHRVWQYDNMTTWQAPPAICVDTEVQLSSLLLL